MHDNFKRFFFLNFEFTIAALGSAMQVLSKRSNLQHSLEVSHIHYSVTQSYANSFWEDVVLDTFNSGSRDEDNILDQIYLKQICPDFYYDDFWFS